MGKYKYMDLGDSDKSKGRWFNEGDYFTRKINGEKNTS